MIKNFKIFEEVGLEYRLLLYSTIGDLNRVKELIEQGVDIETKDEKGDTPLMNASIKNRLNVVKYLVENGANVHAENQKCLSWAKHNEHDNVVKYLESKIYSSLSLSHININKIKNTENIIKKCNGLSEKEIETYLYNLIDNTKLRDFDDYDMDLLLNNKKINKVLFKIENDLK